MSTLGYNTGIIEDYYRQYLENPESVSESWREFFAGYTPVPGTTAPARPAAPAAPAASSDGGSAPVAAPRATPAPSPAAPAPPAASGDGAPADGATRTALRGASAKIVENMEASLGVPTATSVRTFPVKLLSENRRLINEHQKRVGGDKVSFTHLIAYAMVEAIKTFPSLNTTYSSDGGTPTHVVPPHVNLGLAIDVEKRGKRSLVVPSIKAAETLSFAGLLSAYNGIVRKSKDGALTMEDFQGTTVSLTNPGMIGTTLSVPRLMPGQGVILGVGAIGYPPEYYGMDPAMAARSGLSEVMTLTSTYDHRVIQGAESGAFLARLVELLVGQHGFYESVFGSLCVLAPPFKQAVDTTPVGAGIWGELDERQQYVRKQARVLELIRAFRVRGHLQADVNPLGYEWTSHAELDPAAYGLTVWDLDRTFITGGLGGRDAMTLREILDALRATYTSTVGVEFMHITSVEEKRWIIEKVEGTALTAPLTTDEKKRVLDRLGAAEAFETFLHTKYVGQKRFSLQGADSTIPFLDGLLTAAAEGGVRESVMGMAHRGRLNVLANTLGKRFGKIFGEFEGNIDPGTMHGSGDVKYHLGMTGEHTAPNGQTVGLLLAANPSHLEAVDPVVEGMTRARQDVLLQDGYDDDPAQDAVLPILMHGDAAFAGQGVVPETLNLSQLRGYKTGGTVHLVINNQIGFTTVPADSRSTTYATDVARMVQSPVFHVNGDDPEAVLRVARLAFAYRQAFNKDVVVDLLCYRVYGHNEGDEPTYTQPVLYRKIQGKRTPRLLYTERLVRRGDLTPPEAEAMMDSFRARLTDAFHETRGVSEPADGAATDAAPAPASTDAPATAVAREGLLAVTQALMRHPEGFAIHPKLERQFSKRGELFEAGKIDWGFGEALAFGTLLAEGTPVRITGQDCAARHVLAPPRGALRPADGRRVHPAQPHPGRAGRAARLRLVALRIRRVRLRVRLLGGPPGGARDLGGAVWRLRERRADHLRPVSRRRARPSGGRRRASCCCCRTATKARGPSTRPPAWSAFCSSAPRTT